MSGVSMLRYFVRSEMLRWLYFGYLNKSNLYIRWYMFAYIKANNRACNNIIIIITAIV